ncbi:hypothetical protein [Gynurincola endophyticus]|uniref:hypothetical protein n=1 Tax=Gynurincola endophyticus TaxID=2479004 RepID=UPI000F8D2A86|nr:hypothetical protein [Gynurincola endophyticus]
MQAIEKIKTTLSKYNNSFLSEYIKIEGDNIVSKGETIGILNKKNIYLNYRIKIPFEDTKIIADSVFKTEAIDQFLRYISDESDKIIFQLKGQYDIDSNTRLNDEYKIQFNRTFQLSEKLCFSNILLYCKNRYYEDQLSSRALYFQTELKIGDKELISKWHLGYDNEISINIESVDTNNDIINLKDIAEIVGIDTRFDFNNSFNFSIKKFNTSFSFADKKPQINSVGFIGQVTGILQDLKFEIGFEYNIKSKISLFSIKLLEDITIKSLLEKLGITKDHLSKLSWLDNISINNFEFYLIDNKYYSVTIEIDFEDISIEIGDYNVMPKEIILNVKKEEDYEISFEITGEILKNDECIQTAGYFKYDKKEGFTFDFSIYNLDVFKFIDIEKPDFIDILKGDELTISKHSSGFEIKGELSCEFSLPFKYHSSGGSDPKLFIKHFEFSKTNGFKLAGEIKNFIADTTTFEISNEKLEIVCNNIDILSIIENFCGFTGNPNLSKARIENFTFSYVFREKSLEAGVKNLDIEVVGLKITKAELLLSISTTSVNFKIGGQVEFTVKEEKLIFRGSLIFGTSGVSLSAEVIAKIKILENLYIIDPSIQILIQPNSQGIGLYGMLAFRDKIINGIVYVDLLKPEFQLVGINFSGINFTEIISDILGAENNPIPGEISLMPTKVNEDISKTIKNKLSLPNNILYIDRDNFYVYEEKLENGIIEYYKYVHFYESTVSVELFEKEYKEGISFSGLITIFDTSVVIDFSAIRNKGIMGEVSFNKPVKIGDIIELGKSKFDTSPDNIGPYLKISTYPDNPYFNLSCNLNFLNGLLTADTYININNSSLHIEAEAIIWQYYIYFKLKSNYGNFSSGIDLSLEVLFRSNGFTAITQKISQGMKKTAEEVKGTLEEKKIKIEEYKTQINKYVEEVNSLDQDINYCQNRINYLNNLSFSWYESYKYIPVYAEISGYSIRIGSDWTSKKIAIGLLEAAKATLQLIDSITDLTGEAYILALKGISILTEIIGNTLDWVFSIRQIEANATITKSSLYFKGNISFKLLGVDYEENIEFNLSNDKKSSNLENKIKAISEKDDHSSKYYLSNSPIYGSKKNKYINYISLNSDKELDFYKDVYIRDNNSSPVKKLYILENIINNCDIDSSFMNDYSSLVYEDNTNSKKQKNIFEYFSDLEEYQSRSEKRINNWNTQQENLQEFKSIIENVSRDGSLKLNSSNTNPRLKSHGRRILNIISDLETVHETTISSSQMFNSSKYNVNQLFGNPKIFTKSMVISNRITENIESSSEDLLDSYLITYKDKDIDVYMKSIIAFNIAIIYKELDNPKLVNRFKEKSKKLMRQHISFKSEFYKKFRKKVNNI